MNTKAIKEIPCVIIFTTNRDQGKSVVSQISKQRPGWSVRSVSTAEDLIHILNHSTVDCLLMSAADKEEAEALNAIYTELDPQAAPSALMAVPLEECSIVRQALAIHQTSAFYVLQNNPDNMITAVESVMRDCHAEQKLRQMNTLLAQLIEERSKTLHESSERVRFLSEFCSDAIFEVEKEHSS